MKRTLVIILLLVALIATSKNPLRIATCTVTEQTDTTYTVVDKAGEAWVFDDDNHYTIGQKVTVVFNTLKTTSIFDDEIIYVK